MYDPPLAAAADTLYLPDVLEMLWTLDLESVVETFLLRAGGVLSTEIGPVDDDADTTDVSLTGVAFLCFFLLKLFLSADNTPPPSL